jgi:uncharacterized membrane protein YeaQ/YmgE (transglycosylase-associated protein family)
VAECKLLQNAAYWWYDVRGNNQQRATFMSILWTIIVGAIVGSVAKFIMPGKNEPQGFILTAILGIVGALVATYGGQAIGFYSAGETAGWFASLIGAILVLVVYGMVMKPKA